MKIISISLQKGGTAKTTTALNLASDLGKRGKKVLLIDMDSQANASFASGLNTKDLDNSLFNVLTDNSKHKCRIREAILKLKYYDIVPADRDVAYLVDELISPYVLKSVLKTISNAYDYVVLDTPPNLSIVTLNAMVASDYIIIPIEPKPFNFTGMRDLEDTIKDVQKNWNKSLKVLGILLVKYSNRTNLNKQMKELIESEAVKLDTTCFECSIREGIAVSESQLKQMPLIDHSPSAKPTIDYKAFTTEVLKRLGDL